MTTLTQLHLEGVRNLVQTDLIPGKGINLITGENGAGKSSLLEAIHILSTGRSFRTSHIRDVIQHTQEQLLVSGSVNSQQHEIPLGVEKSTQKIRARLNRKPVKRISELTKVLPLVLLHPSSYTLLTGEPAKRRAYLDWGAFHSEPEFHQHWRGYKRVLEQRNAAIRKHSSQADIEIWNEQLARFGAFVHQSRSEYLQAINQIIPEIHARLGFDYEINCEYRPGWNQETSLLEALEQSIDRDRQLKYTYAGPHRADLLVKLDGHKADAIASRGQLKLTTLLLLLSQAVYYQKHSGSACVLLLDDLPSEFDQNHLEKIIAVVQESEAQCFITTIEPDAIPDTETTETTMFHVEHGNIEKQQ